MSADGLTSSGMCQILKAILSNFFFPLSIQSKFYDNFNNFIIEQDFLFSINFLFSCCSLLLLLQARGLSPNCCQCCGVSAGLWIPHLKGLSAKFPIITNTQNVTQSFFQFDAFSNLQYMFVCLICTIFLPQKCGSLLADLPCLSAITYVLAV